MDQMKKPCKECPFTKTSAKGWLADYTPQELHNLVMSENNFPCHMKHEDDLTFLKAEGITTCAGALGYMKKGAKLPRRADLRQKMDNLDNLPKSYLDDILSIPEFFKHHILEDS